jgi:hypothetical protein
MQNRQYIRDPIYIYKICTNVPVFSSFSEMAWRWPLWPELVAINIIL